MGTELIRVVDLFCGAGGLSWGVVEALKDRAGDLAEQHDVSVDEALEQLVDLVAVNHWERAIETHEQNHPWATHYHAKVEAVEPRSVFDEPDPDVKLLVGGPQCTHFSSARGGKPVDEQKRASPWHVLDWVAKLLPENVLLENVPEFESWGPVIDGDPTRNGQFFEAWVETFRGLGYSVAWRTLNAADYGDATSRRRLFIIARRGLQPEWPATTHSEGGEVSGTEPWRPAAEIVDWTDPGESIWSRDRPLVNNTMQRIAEGLRRYCHDDLEPFADAVAELEKADVEAMQENVVPFEDLDSVVEQCGDPFLVKFYGTSTARPLDEPVDTITAGGGKFGLCVPYLLGQQSGAVARDVTEQPTPTIATRGAIGLYQPKAFVLPRNGVQRGLHSNPAYDPEKRPLHTVTAKNHDGHVVTPYLVQYYGQSDAVGIDEPLPTVTTRDRFALVLPEHYPWGLDIRFRMLQPRELAAAMGFPPDYEFAGNKTETVEQIGNAVPVNLAKSLCGRLLAGRDPTLSSFTKADAA
jgi:DNA (cytosine-5)-methyltransferase 1